MAETAKEADFLIVGLNSDDSVKRLKGPERPINNTHDRALILANLLLVDMVVIFEEDTPLRLIQELKPDIIVKGGDYIKTDVVGNKISEVIIFNTIQGYSTTDTLNKVSASLRKGINNS